MIKKIITIFAISALLTACSEDDNTGLSQEVFIAPTATYTIVNSVDKTVTVDEGAIDADAGNNVYTITATLDNAISFDTYIDITATGGSGDASDYSIERIYVPALETEGFGSITINQNCEIEGDENLVFTTNTKEVNVAGSDVFTFNITNDFINSSLDLVMDWAGSYTIEGIAGGDLTLDYCNADLDLLLYDANFAQLGYVLGTADCPEEGPLAGLLDGTYYLVADMFENPYAGLGANQPLPVTLSYSQCGFSENSGTIVNDGYTTESASGLVGIAVVTITNGYEITVEAF